ncbi:hypothetical protein SAMN05444920_102619 [Nonomuraea solani]|uniref:Uncharacterized protein n=1 Tax=Nonomuraea solani TaxID=1144553 RepID=A0A1H5ZAK9_9ACTN|nr:hypothetical protein [Nonomuraea solani]SEG33418.1 hypothetical protein SAMN05444920_102619 [Nonomuraea solani]
MRDTTVHFAIRSGSSAVCPAKVGSQRPYRTASRAGTRIAPHRTYADAIRETREPDVHVVPVATVSGGIMETTVTAKKEP